jgi:nicotinate-nucleotide--dimethylbenzimidazole phosphoribosyltransferase
MPWPDIFFKAKKRPETDVPPPFPLLPPEVAKPPAPLPPVPSKTQALAPVPAPTKPPPMSQVPRLPTEPLPAAALKAPTQSQRSTRTLPVVHGVILRPPARPSTGRLTVSSTPAEPMKNIEQLMAEADPVKTLSQTGNVRMLRRLVPEAPALRPPGTPLPIRAENIQASAPAPSPAPAPVMTPPQPIPPASPWPSFQAKTASLVPEAKKSEPIPAIPIRKVEPLPPIEIKKAEPPAPTLTHTVAIPLHQPKPVVKEPPITARPAAAATAAPAAAPSATAAAPAPTRPPPPGLPPMIAIGSVVKRKAKLADVARLVLPPKREETGPLPQASASAATVVPPAFPVPSINLHPLPKPLPKLVLPPQLTPAATESPFMERTSAKAPPADPSAPIPAEVEVAPPTTPAEAAPAPAEAKPVEAKPPPAPERMAVQPQLPLDAPVTDAKPETPAPAEAPKPAPTGAATTQPIFDFAPKTDFEAPKLDPSLVFDPATMPAKVEPAEAKKPSPVESPVESAPQAVPEAHTPPPAPAPAAPSAPAEIAPAAAPGTREFHLTNGEHVGGVVLSETPDTVYIEHATLGVLTIPRGEIATRLVEIILINGDRIVGNIMAETADMLYVRHASLGMLSVPRAQRSTRVVEAILKNGDRILGEVLTETDAFTVIKSATLGTVTVPHDKLNMLNRKIEQIEMKALPTSPSQLADKSA